MSVQRRRRGLFSYSSTYNRDRELIEPPLRRSTSPNIYLTGTMVSTRRCLSIRNRSSFQPGATISSVDLKATVNNTTAEEGSLSITTRDATASRLCGDCSGTDRRVSEVIQQIPGDPRQFYYGAKRAQTIQNTEVRSIRSLMRGSG